ncbi:hypothetical protein CEXT_61091 [Caerostris extrusa]|uniref:Uncharacterized protein n=1 Tax=Caerostris extrusa TaxID=172846 RepID=A0AAV4SIN1_CAEEX|nr:hypothetical protein CEXT_61091 [Caerostris extrusa]
MGRNYEVVLKQELLAKIFPELSVDWGLDPTKCSSWWWLRAVYGLGRSQLDLVVVFAKYFRSCIEAYSIFNINHKCGTMTNLQNADCPPGQHWSLPFPICGSPPEFLEQQSFIRKWNSGIESMLNNRNRSGKGMHGKQLTSARC